MLKILFYLSALFAFLNLMILITSTVATIMSGGGSVLFPGLGLVVSLYFILLVLLVVEILAIIISVILYRKVYA